MALNPKKSLHKDQWDFSDGETTSERVQKMISQTNLWVSPSLSFGEMFV